MTSTAAVLLGVTLAIALGNWIAVAVGNRTAEYLLKPATMVALGAMLLALDLPDGVVRWWHLAAIVLSLAGDVFLMLPSDRFVEGLAPFLLAHLAYIIGMLMLGIDGPMFVVGVVVAVAVMATVGRTVVAGAKSTDPRLAAPVMAYVAVIAAMIATAFGTALPLAIVGALLFGLSDSIIGWTRFGKDVPNSHVIIMVTYHLGQIGLVLAAVRLNSVDTLAAIPGGPFDLISVDSVREPAVTPMRTLIIGEVDGCGSGDRQRRRRSWMPERGGNRATRPRPGAARERTHSGPDSWPRWKTVATVVILGLLVLPAFHQVASRLVVPDRRVSDLPVGACVVSSSDGRITQVGCDRAHSAQIAAQLPGAADRRSDTLLDRCRRDIGSRLVPGASSALMLRAVPERFANRETGNVVCFLVPDSNRAHRLGTPMSVARASQRQPVGSIPEPAIPAEPAAPAQSAGDPSELRFRSSTGTRVPVPSVGRIAPPRPLDADPFGINGGQAPSPFHDDGSSRGPGEISERPIGFDRVPKDARCSICGRSPARSQRLRRVGAGTGEVRLDEVLCRTCAVARYREVQTYLLTRPAGWFVLPLALVLNWWTSRSARSQPTPSGTPVRPPLDPGRPAFLRFGPLMWLLGVTFVAVFVLVQSQAPVASVDFDRGGAERLPSEAGSIPDGACVDIQPSGKSYAVVPQPCRVPHTHQAVRTFNLVAMGSEQAVSDACDEAISNRVLPRWSGEAVPEILFSDDERLCLVTVAVGAVHTSMLER